MPFEISLPEVVGDPAGMRQLASELKQDARKLTDVAGRLTSSAGAMTFDGPAGDRFRRLADSSTGDLTGHAEQLTALAGKLMKAAEEVERLQQARLRKIAELRREYAAAGIPARVLS